MTLSSGNSHQPQRAQLAVVPQDSLRVQPLMHIGKLLSDLGTEPAPVVARAGIDADLLSAAENTISFERLQALLREAVWATGCEHLGLLIGVTALSNPIGLVGEVSLHCSNVGTAIAYFQQHFHLHDRIGIATRSVDGKNATLGYVLFHGSSAEADQIHDAALAIGLSLMRLWAGPDWKPRAVTLPRRRPRDVQAYRKVFGVVPQFECEHPALHFDVSDFSQSIQGANPARFAMLSEKVGSVASERDLKFSDQVRRMMRGLIALQRCSADDLASAFSMIRSHMNRKLTAEGMNYRLIHEEAQRALAERMLLRTDKSLVEISLALSYSDATAFSRAFRRWHGCSPSEWRTRTA